MRAGALEELNGEHESREDADVGEGEKELGDDGLGDGSE